MFKKIISILTAVVMVAAVLTRCFSSIKANSTNTCVVDDVVGADVTETGVLLHYEDGTGFYIEFK